jgi:phage terminase large subunit-like protein
MGPAIERFATDVREGAVTHAGDPVLTRHVLTARRHETRGDDGNALLRKPGGSEYDHIDAAVAAVLAHTASWEAFAAGEGRSAAVHFW